jgi:hypothetical protein
MKMKDNINMEHREIGWEAVEWINVAQDTDWWWVFVNVVMSLLFS